MHLHIYKSNIYEIKLSRKMLQHSGDSQSICVQDKWDKGVVCRKLLHLVDLILSFTQHSPTGIRNSITTALGHKCICVWCLETDAL